MGKLWTTSRKFLDLKDILCRRLPGENPEGEHNSSAKANVSAKHSETRKILPRRHFAAPQQTFAASICRTTKKPGAERRVPLKADERRSWDQADSVLSR
ncbi:MAG: hypothetical protein WA975_10630 [Mesorhizobium sp.]